MEIESEKALERKLAKEVKRLGGYSFKFVPLFVSGIPDRINFLPGGITFFAEIKTTKQKPKKLQIMWLNIFKKLGFDAYLIDTSEQIKEIIKKYE